jgi:hypothetical protein
LTSGFQGRANDTVSAIPTNHASGFGIGFVAQVGQIAHAFECATNDATGSFNWRIHQGVLEAVKVIVDATGQPRPASFTPCPY